MAEILSRPGMSILWKMKITLLYYQVNSLDYICTLLTAEKIVSM